MILAGYTNAKMSQADSKFIPSKFDCKLVTMQEAERFTHKDNLLIYFLFINYIFFVNLLILFVYVYLLTFLLNFLSINTGYKLYECKELLQLWSFLQTSLYD